MHLLLIHQNFPGQFRDLAPAWLTSGHQVTAIGSMAEAPSGLQWQGLTYLQYRFEQAPSHLQRGLAVARLVDQLLDQEDPPDLVMSHSAWGEALCLQRVCGDVPCISYPELWGNSRSLGFGFDQALDGFEPDATSFSSANLIAELAVFQSSAAVVASRSQLLSFPPDLQQRLTLLPEGVDLERIKPDPNACLHLSEQALELRAGQPLVTFISRDLEPLRGLHQLLKAWPLVSQTLPEAQLVLVGGTGQGYGLQAPKGQNHLEDALDQLPDTLNREQINHLGPLPHAAMLTLLQCSACHVVLSYPYTLSWSVLEALACAAPIISNPDSPISVELQECANDALALVPFNDADGLASRMIELLQQPQQARALGAAGRDWIERHGGLSKALKGYEKLFQSVREQVVT
ncbi:glycosyl transferase/ family 1 [Synechococcus sp. RS9915]|nr:glycosyl transferase/ family 1 [Synechococcus sp. RS9915]